MRYSIRPILMLFTLLIPITIYAGDLNKDLRKAAKDGKKDKVQALLKVGADVNSKDGDGRIALHIAAEKGRTEIVRLLLEAGADVDSKDRKGMTALMLAARKGDMLTVIALLDKSADVNAVSNVGSTALVEAGDAGHAEIVRLLWRRGARVPTLDLTGVWEGTWTSTMDYGFGVRDRASSFMTLTLQQTGIDVTGTVTMEGNSKLRPYEGSVSGTIWRNTFGFYIHNGATRITLVANPLGIAGDAMIGGDGFAIGMSLYRKK